MTVVPEGTVITLLFVEAIPGALKRNSTMVGGIGRGVGVGTSVGVGAGIGMALEIGTGVAVGTGVGVAVGAGRGVGVAPSRGVTETDGFCETNWVGTGVARNALAKPGRSQMIAARSRRPRRGRAPISATERRHVGRTGVPAGGSVADLRDEAGACIGSLTG